MNYFTYCGSNDESGVWIDEDGWGCSVTVRASRSADIYLEVDDYQWDLPPADGGPVERTGGWYQIVRVNGAPPTFECASCCQPPDNLIKST